MCQYYIYNCIIQKSKVKYQMSNLIYHMSKGKSQNLNVKCYISKVESCLAPVCVHYPIETTLLVHIWYASICARTHTYILFTLIWITILLLCLSCLSVNTVLFYCSYAFYFPIDNTAEHPCICALIACTLQSIPALPMCTITTVINTCVVGVVVQLWESHPRQDQRTTRVTSCPTDHHTLLLSL